MLQLEQHSFRTDLVFGDVIITALLSIALFVLVSVIERLALPWYFAAGREQDWRQAGQRPKRRRARRSVEAKQEASALVGEETGAARKEIV